MNVDNEIFNLEKKEFLKRNNELDFIASQNLCSEEILEACGSISQMKYAEGFPGKRYYAGCEVVDEIETRCQEELLKLFDASEEYLANVQPANGSSANFITYRALLESGDIVLAPSTEEGGHISHGHPLSTVANFYDVVTYGLNIETEEIDYDEIEELAMKFHPTLIIAGMSNYSRKIDYKRFREIANKCGAYLMADIAHISGLIASGLHPSPVGLADVITSTTHKILRGPRSAFIIYKKDLDAKIKRATIPGCFGGPDEAKIMAKLICFKEAQTTAYKFYCFRVTECAKAMVDVFIKNGVSVLSGGTENHSFCLDLTDYPCSGRDLANALASVGLITNCNAIPNEPRTFFNPSGLRMGTQSVVTRGLNTSDCASIAYHICEYLNALKCEEHRLADSILEELRNLIAVLTKMHPLKEIYPKKYNKLFE